MIQSRIFIGLLIITLLFACSEETIEPEEFAIITGVVIDSETGIALEGVQISTNPLSEETLSDSTGKFTLNNVPIGNISVQGTKDEYLLSYEAVVTSAGQTVNVVLELVHENANNRPPNSPILLTPENREDSVQLNIDLVWQSTVDPDGDETTYKLVFFEEGSDDLMTLTNLTDTTYTVNDLEYNTRYYWQVSSKDEFNEEYSTSELYSFLTIPFPENRIYFTRQVNGNNVIYSTNEEGDETKTIPITDETVNSWRPRQNPSSEVIAFLRNVGSETHIFTMKPDGSEITQITNIPIGGFRAEEIDYTWTDQGAKILYPYFDKLYSINHDGTGLQLLYTTPNGKFISEAQKSSNGGFIALKVNNTDGYDAEIYTIDLSGNPQDTIVYNSSGALGGLDVSFDGQQIVYTRDVSGFENNIYRQLNTHIFIFNMVDQTVYDLSQEKPAGYNDLDPRFSPNEAEIIFTYTSNDGVSEKFIYRSDIPDDPGDTDRVEIIGDASMPDWK